MKNAWKRLSKRLAGSSIVFRGLKGNSPFLPFDLLLVEEFVKKYPDSEALLLKALASPSPNLVAYSLIGLELLDSQKVINGDFQLRNPEALVTWDFCSVQGESSLAEFADIVFEHRRRAGIEEDKDSSCS